MEKKQAASIGDASIEYYVRPRNPSGGVMLATGSIILIPFEKLMGTFDAASTMWHDDYRVRGGFFGWLLSLIPGLSCATFLSDGDYADYQLSDADWSEVASIVEAHNDSKLQEALYVRGFTNITGVRITSSGKPGSIAAAIHEQEQRQQQKEERESNREPTGDNDRPGAPARDNGAANRGTGDGPAWDSASSEDQGDLNLNLCFDLQYRDVLGPTKITDDGRVWSPLAHHEVRIRQVNDLPFGVENPKSGWKIHIAWEGWYGDPDTGHQAKGQAQFIYRVPEKVFQDVRVSNDMIDKDIMLESMTYWVEKN